MKLNQENKELLFKFMKFCEHKIFTGGRNNNDRINYMIQSFENTIKSPDEEAEEYAYDNPVYSRKDILELIKLSFPDKRMNGIYSTSASIELQRFETQLRELGKQRAYKKLVKGIYEYAR